MTAHNEIALRTIEIETGTPVKASIIWLHGLGADGHDFTPYVSELTFPSNFGVRFIFPHAPMRPVTLNNGYVMRAWYDIVGLSKMSKIDHDGIAQAVKQVASLIDTEIARGIPANKIILAGFSQGAVIAMACGLTYQHALAGVIALSGYLPFTADELVIKHPIPLFLAHGIQDTVVPYMLGLATNSKLSSKQQVTLTFKSYSSGHTVCPEEIKDINQWLNVVLRK